MGRYCVAQVCTNGHLIVSCVDICPEFSEKFCSKCGASTIRSCPACCTAIRGLHYSEEDFPSLIDTPPPAYCFSCGAAFPWTESRLQAAREMTEAAEDLSQDKDALVAALPDLVSERPGTQLAASRWRLALAKLKGPVLTGFRQILTELACEGARKVLFGSSMTPGA